MTLKEKMDAVAERDFERAVSPVIGVILMVAITVILAAVIGTFVMGLGNSVEKNVNAGAEISADKAANGAVTVTWVSKGTASQVSVKVKEKGGTNNGTATINNIGDSVTIYEKSGGNDDLGFSADGDRQVQIIVTAIGEDGETKTVINNEEATI
ncbi:type IV pilin N-terminal domain-containing protein [Haladaptatus caseinilyticus]|uniref:type IV pilin N-terminal domain-containing protein n=1 Tax=Haladaptatus caseinilyticus TaxID=2993314 RepID=UPI00224AC6A5|nr:type IV pilin N-terminal domain-containing protein [Haladaptatus caseinilyticus]